MTNQGCVAVGASCVFIVTKPLQLMVAMAIVEQLPLEAAKDLILVDSFYGAKGISDRVAAAHSGWSRVTFLPSVESALADIERRNCDTVFIDSDVGLRKYFQLIRLKLVCTRVNVVIYEEGLGTYRADLYVGFKKKLLRLVGAGNYFGGCWLTDYIFLYSPDEYVRTLNIKKNKTVRINKPISNLCVERLEWLKFVFELQSFQSAIDSAGSSNCVIYLTAWNWDQEIINNLCSMSSFKVLKYHPHIKTPDEEVGGSFDHIAAPAIPAELLIAAAAAAFASVVVYHHGSSVVRYSNFQNVRFVMISS